LWHDTLQRQGRWTHRSQPRVYVQTEKALLGQTLTKPIDFEKDSLQY
jgi:hypothetical protein